MPTLPIIKSKIDLVLSELYKAKYLKNCKVLYGLSYTKKGLIFFDFNFKTDVGTFNVAFARTVKAALKINWNIFFIKEYQLLEK